MVVGATWLRPQGHAASPNHTHTRHTQPLGGWHIPPSPCSAPSLVHMLRKWLRLLWHQRLLLLRLSFVVLHVVVPIIVRAVHYFEDSRPSGTCERSRGNGRESMAAEGWRRLTKARSHEMA